MKFSKVSILLIPLVLTFASNLYAQDSQSVVQIAENLRTLLHDVQTEEADLQARAQQLDWDLRPENIERYFAGTGSTRPEELREQRRRLLQNEKDRVLARLERLAASRARLESSIAAADAEVYRQSAENTTSMHFKRMLGAQHLNTARLMLIALAFMGIMGTLALVAVVYWRRRSRMGRAPVTAP
ncbi:MAG TPA: hypothetical protein VIW80_14120 [Pyrinomonadaceae bacterium]|jgi:uncharacterized protein YlxW (UPF0749 family)